MEEDNVFSKLRRIAKNVQNETALAKERMSRPLAVRSSGDSARPVIRRMQREAHEIKRESEKAVSSLPPATDFSTLIDACSQLCVAYRSKVDALEDYLLQYGYQPPHSNTAKGTSAILQEKRVTSAPAQTTTPAEGKVTATDSQDNEEMKENIPFTPPKNPEMTSSFKGGTPKLEDYGLSRGFLDMMARNKLRGPEEPRPASSMMEGRETNSVYIKKDTAEAFTPMHHPNMAGMCPFTPIGVTTTPARVTVTPGMFGGAELPTETPTQFVDMVTGRPPGNNRASGYHGDGPKKSLQFGAASHRAHNAAILDAFPDYIAKESNAQIGTPPPPELTARWNFTSAPAPPPKQLAPTPTPATNTVAPVQEMNPPLSYHHGSVDTPPEPEMTMKWDSRTISDIPKAPERLAAQVPHVLMEEPVRLTSQLPRHTPEEPQLLRDKYGAPSHVEDTPETPPGLSGNLGRSKAFDFSKFLTEDMPKTPELTMSYSRYVDPKTVAAEPERESVPSGVPHNNPPSHYSGHPSAPRMEGSRIPVRPSGGMNVNARYPAIRHVTEAEFEGQNDFMKRILPLDLFNQVVIRMNAILQCKANNGEEACLTDGNVESLELGAKTKALLLILTRLQRITSTAGAYYPIP